MIVKQGKEINSLHKGGKLISMIYKGARIVWQAIRSCFGTGIWRRDKPWVSEDKWKNNK